VDSIIRETTYRAQSEVVGVALLVGVFSLLAIIVGVVFIGNVTDQADSGPLVEVNASATGTDLVLTHEGGDALDATEIIVIVRQGGEEWRYGLDSFAEVRGSDSGQFAGGERWDRTHDLAVGSARLLVVHGPSNTVVQEVQFSVPPETIERPSAQFEYSPTEPGTGEAVTFDASNSTDDGTITDYAWDFDGDGTTDATGETATTSYATPGTYDVTLTVTDDEGLTDSATRTVTVNSLPTAAFTWTCGDNECTFDASDSTDDGTIANYTWAFDDGNVTTTTDPVIEHAYDESDEYNVTLTVTDSFGATDETTELVDSNTPPTASFDASCPDLSGTCTFGATNSTDTDGTIANYTWDFDDGNVTTTTDPVIDHTYDRGDTYNVTLTVADTAGDSNTTSESVPVVVRSVAWAINAGGGDYTASDGTEYVADTNVVGGSTFSTGDPIADTSDDPLYQSERYGDFTYGLPVEDGEYRVTLQFAEIYWTSDGQRVFDTSVEGERVVRELDIHEQVGHDRAFDVRNVTTVTDDELTVEFTTIQDNAKVGAILVENFTGPNLSPTANFTAPTGTVSTAESIQFTDTSTDRDGVVQSWQWDFGDGTTATQRDPTHSYDSAGIYTVTLTVTDDDGATDTTERTVEVSEPPTASFTYDCTGTDCTFDAADSSDSDGTVVSYEWDWTDDGTVDLNTTSDTATHSYSQPGSYTVALTVTDDDGLTDTIRKTVSTGGGIAFGTTTTGVFYDSVVAQNFDSTRNDDVSVVRVKVNETNNNVVELDASRTGFVEVEWYDANGETGSAGTPGGYALPADVDMTADGDPASFASGESQSLYLTEFLNNGGQPVGMSGEQLRITITYEVSGKRYTISESVTVN
jgi:PKD repeat protein